jgi:hypothetical protein
MGIDSLEYEGVDDALEDLENDEGIVICPHCGGEWVRVEGKCITCETCGWSKCEIYE